MQLHQSPPFLDGTPITVKTSWAFFASSKGRNGRNDENHLDILPNSAFRTEKTLYLNVENWISPIRRF
jgi:hypothetical protein